MEDNQDNRFGTSDTRFKFDDIRENTEFEFRPRSETELPDDVKEKFEADGYRLRWVRYLAGGQVDTKNLRQKIHEEGFEFVKPEEIDNEASSIGDMEEIRGYGENVTLGDLVLMKVPAFKADARRRYYENETRKKTEATDALLRQNAIENGSKSVTRTGKGAARYSND